MANHLIMVNTVIASSLNHNFMIYKWPLNLLKKFIKAMRNFLCFGNIEKTKLVKVALEGTISHQKRGRGLGIRCLEATNLAFLKKLAWGVMTDNSLACDFMRRKYVQNFCQLKNCPAMPSIWPTTRSHCGMLLDESIWIAGSRTKLDFLKDNQKGYRIESRIHITNSIPLESKVGDFFVDNKWVLPNLFFESFPNIAIHIEKVVITKGCIDVIRWQHLSEGIPKTRDFL